MGRGFFLPEKKGEGKDQDEEHCALRARGHAGPAASAGWV